ncbi:hypothetical protein NDI76_15005 [Halogeometricum sp. S1BR25-6]|uniref:Right handed beta helix domain-containing protein n=1 Tax=Halogeometricum salsisoli TaxID=2950536 RepID=A0ABU2GJ14_9EURY|nr:hypothetical protein [Halogeometricum sp. S1BR25-6]MDS0300053.1 hypothetical protein [Halogeometricum sp. S1BR25-6]
MAPRRVPEDGRITEPGEYALTGNRTVRGASPPSEAMIRIAADGVTLDGRGHALVGGGVSDTTAIAADGESGVSEVVVENVAVEAWEVGLSFRNLGRATVRGVEATGNSYGLLLEGVAALRLADCEVRENLVGVSADAASAPVAPALDFGSGTDVSANRLADVRRGDDC